MDSENETTGSLINEEKLEASDKVIKKPKRGIIYLSTIPPYMNVTLIREFFEDFGKIGNIYLQPADAEPKDGGVNLKPMKKRKKKKFAKHFTEGWIEFERKSVAKKVAAQLNNKQVNSRKGSKQFDCLWSIKYLSNFKWAHLNERLAYEKAIRRQKLRDEIEQAKKQAHIFNLNVERSAKSKKTNTLNRILPKKRFIQNEKSAPNPDRGGFVANLFES